MDIRPILSSLRKHLIPASLIVMEAALSCAVLCNAVFMIGQRIEVIGLPTSMDEKGVTVFSAEGGDPSRAASDISQSIAALRSVAGVQDVAAFSSIPFDKTNWMLHYSSSPDPDVTHAKNLLTEVFSMTKGGPEALGLHLVSGRFFNEAEYSDGKLTTEGLPVAPAALVTQSFADQMWPGQSALGHTIYSSLGHNAYTVVGVVGDVLAPGHSDSGEQVLYNAAFFPVTPGDGLGYYVVRSSPQARQVAVRDGSRALVNTSPHTVIEGKTFEDIRRDYFSSESSMAWILALVCAVMLVVTALGIVGLTSFWVQQRRRQVGVRRALGATRGDILRLFQTENLLLSGGGAIVGVFLALEISTYLVRHYEIGHLPLYYLPICALVIVVIGQIAVLAPALRAASVPPTVAIRS
jgi:putative ABC transport system permease protein